MMRRGSANTDIVLISVAMISPLRSRISGRAPETASEAACLRFWVVSGLTPRNTSLPEMSPNTAMKASPT